MPKESRNSQTVRKEPSLIGSLLSKIVSTIFWLCISLLISIVIEWIGIKWFWPEQGANHAKNMLAFEQQFLNELLRLNTAKYVQVIYETTQITNQWVTHIGKLLYQYTGSIQLINNIIPFNLDTESVSKYIDAVPYVAQVFFTRIAIIVFALPAFILSGIYGAVDGLVERDLRRWGGGRESSNVYNIARKSIFPIFITACIIYLSLPISIHPLWVIMPFVIAFGFSVRVSFERLKKYF